jgi:hypothetical protein
VCVCVCWDFDGAAIGGGARLWAAAAAVDWTRRTRMRTPHGGGITARKYTFCVRGQRATGARRSTGPLARAAVAWQTHERGRSMCARKRACV